MEVEQKDGGQTGRVFHLFRLSLTYFSDEEFEVSLLASCLAVHLFLSGLLCQRLLLLCWREQIVFCFLPGRDFSLGAS